MREADVGEYYLDAANNVWRLISYTDQPTATLQMVRAPEFRRSGVVGSPVLQEFRRLAEVHPGVTP